MYRILPPRRIGSRAIRVLILAFALGLVGRLILPDRLLNKLQPTAQAASPFTVNSLGDSADVAPGNGICADSSGNCTLRAAIQEANSFAGDDTINFSVTGTINLDNVLPIIASNMIITGPGANTLTVQRSSAAATPNFRILTINSNVTVTISRMTVSNGRSADGVPAAVFGNPGDTGGGILNAGSLTLLDLVITANRSGNGGVPSGPGSDGVSYGGPGGAGGGIFNSGSLTMTNVTVSNNRTGDGASSYYGGSGGSGAGIYQSEGTLTMTGCMVTGNVTANGAISTGGSGGGGGYGGGVFIRVGTVKLVSTSISNNTTGGAPADTTTRSISGGAGGGIAVDSSTSLPSGTMLLINCIISGNHTGNGTGFSGQGGFGGGILNGSSSSMTITGSLISGNSTGTDGVGGGIDNSGALSLNNSTVSGNSTGGSGGRGSGIWNAHFLTLTNCSIVLNSAVPYGGAGIHQYNDSSLVIIRNTIVAANTVSGQANGLDVSDGPSYNSQGHNLIGNADSSTGFTAVGDQVGTSASPLNPQLGPLADNGGPTLTHALLSNSPALDAGDNCVSQATHCDDVNIPQLATDQRGTARMADSPDADTTATVDIGAFEWQRALEDVTDKTTREDIALSVAFGVGDGGGTISSVTASSDNQTLVPDASLSVTGTAQVRTLQIVPAPNQSGTAHITITTSGTNGVATDSFLLTVTAVNDAPIFTKGPDQIVNEDSGPQTFPAWATSINAGGNEAGQSLTFIVTGNTNPGLFSAAPAVDPSGTLTFTPAANANGNAMITLVLKDDGGTATGGQDTSATQTFLITVTPINDPPVANNQNLTINEDSSIFLGLGGSDIEGGQLTFTVVDIPSHGTLIGSGSSRTYTPALNFSGADSFTYKVTDPLGAESAPATVSITINAINDPPFNSIPGTQVTNQNTSFVFSAAHSNVISVADVDAGTDAIKVTLTATRGVITLGGTVGLTFVTGDGVEDLTMTFTGVINDINAGLNGLTFKPDAGTNGTASLLITTDDQGHNGAFGARTDTDTIFITVRSGGLLQFSATAFTVNENGGVASILVTRTGSSFGAASINYATANGSAAGGATCGPLANYVSSSGAISWVDGDSNFKIFTIPICDDSLTSNGTINLSLTNPGGSAALGARAAATLTIINDGTPVLLAEFNSQHAVTLDSVALTRDPFSLLTSSDFSADRRKRIALFVWGLGLRPSDNVVDVFVQAEDVQGNVYLLPVEYMGPMPGLNGITEVVVLLPETVLGAPRDLFVTIRLRGAISDRTVISIAAP